MEAIKVSHFGWEHPSNIMIAGPSKCGKTEFVRKMIRHTSWLFKPAIHQVVFSYGIWQEAYDEMKEEFGTKVKWVRGLPEQPFSLFHPNKGPGLMIVDDLMGGTGAKQDQVSKWFTKGSHHMNMSMAILVQNVFPKNLRTVSVNADIMVLFDNPRDQSQIKRLMSQAFPGKMAWIKSALTHAYSRPFRPLILNFHQSTPQELRLTMDLFPEDLKESKSPFPKAILPPTM